MPRFLVAYRSPKDKHAKKEEYLRESRRALLRELRESGLTPISITERNQEGNQNGTATHTESYPTGKVKLDEVAVFCRSLAVMLSGGLSITDSIDDLAEQTGNTRFQGILYTVSQDIRAGASLSEAMDKHPACFSSLLRYTVRAGEGSGNLDTIFSQMAEHFERQLELQQRVKAGTRYPIFILGVFFIVLFVIFVFILPQFEAIFGEYEAKLPTLTRVVIGISNTLADNIFAFLAGFAAIIIGITLGMKTERGGWFRDRLTLRLPLIGPLARQLITARFARTLALLGESGVSWVQALELCGKASGNRVVDQEIQRIADAVVSGSNLSQELHNHPLFPRMMARMSAAGEATGNLSELLTRVADHYTNEAQKRIDGLLALLEPTLLVLLGAVVTFVAFSVYLPVFKLGTAIGAG